jgi:hypothetical protein
MLTVESSEGMHPSLDTWYDRFRFYRHPPSREEIYAWLSQFAENHSFIAAKVLDNVVIISDAEVQQAYRDALARIGGWAKDHEQRKGRWVFLGLGGQAESGPAMLHMFREAAGLQADRYQELFKTLADLPRMKLTTEDTVIFVDDFAGSGDQFIARWETNRELIASEARIFLFLAAATSKALTRLADIEDVKIEAGRELAAHQNILSEECGSFSPEEKLVILSYCKRADRRNPKGWKDCGLLLVISRKTPNNSLPILHARSRRWIPLFPRQLAH